MHNTETSWLTAIAFHQQRSVLTVCFLNRRKKETLYFPLMCFYPTLLYCCRLCCPVTLWHHISPAMPDLPICSPLGSQLDLPCLPHAISMAKDRPFTHLLPVSILCPSLPAKNQFSQVWIFPLYVKLDQTFPTCPEWFTKWSHLPYFHKKIGLKILLQTRYLIKRIADKFLVFTEQGIWMRIPQAAWFCPSALISCERLENSTVYWPLPFQVFLGAKVPLHVNAVLQGI